MCVVKVLSALLLVQLIYTDHRGTSSDSLLFVNSNMFITEHISRREERELEQD